jgi:DNA-directed RNA polymerase specialized sigma24 family protein
MAWQRKTVASIASTKLLFSKVPGTNMTAASAQLAAMTVGSDDLDLVHASKIGDVAAFERLVKRYDRKLFRIAQHVTHNREDAVQEAFLKAFQHLNEFREDSKLSTWLIRITLNQSLMKLRKQRRAMGQESVRQEKYFLEFGNRRSTSEVSHIAGAKS